MVLCLHRPRCLCHSCRLSLAAGGADCRLPQFRFSDAYDIQTPTQRTNRGFIVIVILQFGLPFALDLYCLGCVPVLTKPLVLLQTGMDKYLKRNPVRKSSENNNENDIRDPDSVTELRESTASACSNYSSAVAKYPSKVLVNKWLSLYKWLDVSYTADVPYFHCKLCRADKKKNSLSQGK